MSSETLTMNTSGERNELFSLHQSVERDILPLLSGPNRVGPTTEQGQRVLKKLRGTKTSKYLLPHLRRGPYRFHRLNLIERNYSGFLYKRGTDTEGILHPTNSRGLGYVHRRTIQDLLVFRVGCWTIHTFFPRDLPTPQLPLSVTVKRQQ